MGVGLRLPTCVEVGEVAQEVRAAARSVLEHRGEAVGLRLERRDLAIHPGQGVLDDRASLADIGGRSEPVAVASASGLVLEQLRDLGEAEARLVAEVLDELQPLDVVVVVSR